jgi:aspartate racemase
LLFLFPQSKGRETNVVATNDFVKIFSAILSGFRFSFNTYLQYMKTIGLIGGMTYVSSLEYYRLLNELVQERAGGNEAAEIIMYSVNFGEIKKYTEANDWESLAKIICRVAKTIENAGADCIMIGANTMHKIADEVQASIHIPVIHIADAVADEIKSKKFHTVALLGTKYTMQLDFYKDRLASKGIQVIIPGEEDIEYINYTIYSEFSRNIFTKEAREKYLAIIEKLQSRGAEGIILGCTEIPLLVKQSDCPVTLFDTASIHSEAAVKFALQ